MKPEEAEMFKTGGKGPVVAKVKMNANLSVMILLIKNNVLNLPPKGFDSRSTS